LAKDLAALERLDHRERLSAKVFQRTDEGMALADAAGTVIVINQAWTRTTGRTAEELTGLPLPMFGPDRRDDPVLLEAFRMLAEQGRWQGELTGQRNNGTPYIAAITVTGVRGEVGDVTHFLAVMSDVTEQRRLAEAQAALTAQLERAQTLESLGRLSGGVAHDFNNLLTAISGHADFLLDEVEPGSDAHGSASTIAEACRKAAAVVRQLLAFARKLPGERVPVDLSDAVQSLQRMFGRLLREDIELRLELTPQLRPVLADPGHVDQVIVNLVVNAADAMPAGGTLTLSTLALTDGLGLGQDAVAVRV
jgi:PAS domain S-box-containing protein